MAQILAIGIDLRHRHLRTVSPVDHGGIGRRGAFHVTQQGVRVATDDRIDPRHLGCQFQIAQIADMGQGDDLVDALIGQFRRCRG